MLCAPCTARGVWPTNDPSRTFQTRLVTPYLRPLDRYWHIPDEVLDAHGRATRPSVVEPLSFFCQPRRTDTNLDIQHVLLPNDYPNRPCWVRMEPSWPSQPDLELNRPLPEVAILLLAVSFLALLEPWVVLPTVLGSGRSHDDFHHHICSVANWEELQPCFFHLQPGGFTSSTRIVSPCFTRLRFRRRLSSRAPQCSTKCERIVLGKGAKVLIRESAQGTFHPHHGRRGWRTGDCKGRWERRWKAKSRRESRREYQDNHIMSAWGWDEMKCATHTKLEPMSVWHWNVCCETRENVTCEVCCSHTVGCSRLLSAVNDLTTTSFWKKNLSKCHSEQLWRKRLQQVALFCDAAHFTSSEGIDFDEFMSSTSGHSTTTMMCWMKKSTNAISDTVERNPCMSLFSRLTVKTVHLCYCFAEVWSEFHRCISARCVQRDRPGFLKSLKLLSWWAIGKIFLCQLVHLDTLLLSPISFELRITISSIFLKAIVNSFKTLFDTSPPSIMGYEVLLPVLQFFSMPSTMRSPLLDDIVRDWENIQLLSVKMSAGFAFNQEMSTSAIDHSLIPIKKAFWALHLWNRFAKLE